MKKLDYLCNHKSEIRNVCNEVEGHCLQAIKMVHHHATGRFDWLIAEHQRVNPPREAIFYRLGDTKDLLLSILLMETGNTHDV